MNIKKIAKENILNTTAYKPGKPVAELQRELGIKKIVKLASNESNIGPSPKAIAAIKENLTEINRYPDGGSFYLRDRLSVKLGVKKNNLIFGNGSDDIITLAIRAFLNTGEEVITAEPTFLMYGISTLVNGNNVVRVPMRGFKYDLEAIKKRMNKKTKIVFIANPDNPTGSYLTKDELMDFINTINKDVIVYIDEAYFEFGCKETDYPNNMIEFINKKPVIITRTFSKAYGLAGLRIGYAIANKDIIECLNAVRDPFNVNLLAQCAGLAALDDQHFLNKTVNIIIQGKEYLYSEFSKLGLFYLKSAANFVLVKTEKNSTQIYNDLLRQGIIIRDMKSWGLDNFIRVTVGRKQENVRFIRAFKKAII